MAVGPKVAVQTTRCSARRSEPACREPVGRERPRTRSVSLRPDSPGSQGQDLCHRPGDAPGEGRSALEVTKTTAAAATSARDPRSARRGRGPGEGVGFAEHLSATAGPARSAVCERPSPRHPGSRARRSPDADARTSQLSWGWLATAIPVLGLALDPTSVPCRAALLQPHRPPARIADSPARRAPGRRCRTSTWCCGPSAWRAPLSEGRQLRPRWGSGVAPPRTPAPWATQGISRGGNHVALVEADAG